jgi:hypothetical protein
MPSWTKIPSPFFFLTQAPQPPALLLLLPHTPSFLLLLPPAATFSSTRRSCHGLPGPPPPPPPSEVRAVRRKSQPQLPPCRQFRDGTLGHRSDFLARRNVELVRGEAFTSLGSRPPREHEWRSSASRNAELVRGRATPPVCAARAAPPVAARAPSLLCVGELRCRLRPEPILLTGGAATRWAARGERRVAVVPRADCGERGATGRRRCGR